ncbi:MAG: hypothetical protein DPW16_21540 [Chloroflexi bacterium]|nr:hypothetical protein [Chloroflexota bacterium]MBZ0317264.1 hypothetical protein [Anaerolineae bacterium]MCQ3933042.1 hypothetical protein [Chloroflexota bacterium]
MSNRPSNRPPSRPSSRPPQQPKRDSDFDSLNSLRYKALAEDDDPFSGFEDKAVSRREVDEGRIFGLNAVERMFLSIGLFLVVTVLSVLLLILTDSIQL